MAADRRDQGLSSDFVSVARQAGPLRADLLAVRRGGAAPFRRPPRRGTCHKAHRALPSVGRLGLRSRTGRAPLRGLGGRRLSMERGLLDILCCPVTRSPLEILSERELAALNERI